MKLHVVAPPREAHERERRLPLTNTEFREALRDQVFAVAHPARECLGEVGPPLSLLVVLCVGNAARVEPRRFGVQAQISRVRGGERLD